MPAEAHQEFKADSLPQIKNFNIHKSISRNKSAVLGPVPVRHCDSSARPEPARDESKSV
jgi:hypothetical protein